ncbi:MAG: OmpH family outer membrane protein [Candidatus Jettenia sp. CY-1]|nr:OmpH family outer membrane protein [Candidatus Jettenia sp.]WKZ19417.1 MAG: OmpH family outer membrane protein [Candidatus Jettenia sp. CY-1]
MELETVLKHGRKINNFLCIAAMFTCLYLFSLSGLLLVQAKEAGGDNVPSRNLKLGVVDLNSVFEKYEKRKNFDAQLKEQEKKHQKIINDKKKELVNLNEKIQLLDLGSEARRKDEEAFEKKNIELESYAKFAEKSLMKKYKDYFENLYTEVCKEVENIGKLEQYDLIIKKEEPELQSGGISELQFKVGIKAVLYHSDEIDITNRVIETLNKKYSEASKGK